MVYIHKGRLEGTLYENLRNTNMSLFSVLLTMPKLYILVLGVFFLAEVEKCLAAVGGGSGSLDTERNATGSFSRHHDGRVLESEDTFPGEFPFFAQWGGCGATLIWEDILLTSASVSRRKKSMPMSLCQNSSFF